MITNHKELINSIDEIKEYLESSSDDREKLAKKSAMSIQDQIEIINELNSGKDVECACLIGWYPVNFKNHIFDFYHNVYRKIENDKN